MLIRGDARRLPLVDGCVDCVVTSPPYFGLRDYGNVGQLGLEPSPEAYVAALVAVFAELRRVLKPEGTCWLNLGDSYAGSWGARGRGPDTNAPRPDLEAKYGIAAPNRKVVGAWRSGDPENDRNGAHANRNGLMAVEGCKAKDMIGIPWAIAFALRADGWYLRSDIIWSKPNPMPESVTDRPTKAHEYLFLLSKSERYFYNAAAIAEPVSAAMLMEMEQGYDGLGLKDYDAAGVQNPSTVKARIIANARRRGGHTWDERKALGEGPRRGYSQNGVSNIGVGLNRNKRSVWHIPTMPYAGAHFATMPEKLVEPCILAGCPLGGLVLDPFVGSGTVVAVAQRLGRRGVGVDLSYQDLAKTRTAQQGLRFGA